MFMRYLNLAILATPLLSQSAPEASAANIARQLDRDLTWDIESEDGIPIIDFESITEQTEVVFKYNVTGTLTDRKLLDVKLYENNCVSTSDASLAFANTTSGDELDIDIDIVQDLTANFTLTDINVERDSVDSEADNAQLDYPVETYICLDDNSEVAYPAALTQGSPLQVCVKIDETVVTQNVIVEDIFNFFVSQPDGNATDWETIINAIADPLTYKVTKVYHESGICNVRSQLLYKFFNDKSPEDLRVDGVATMAIGKALFITRSDLAAEGTVLVGRRIRTPIRGLLTGEDSKAFMTVQQRQRNTWADDKETAVVALFTDSAQRMLQDGAVLSEFGLDVALRGAGSGGSSHQDDSSSSIVLYAIVVFVGALTAGCLLFVRLCVERRFGEEKKATTEVLPIFISLARVNMLSFGHHVGTSYNINMPNELTINTKSTLATDDTRVAWEVYALVNRHQISKPFEEDSNQREAQDDEREAQDDAFGFTSTTGTGDRMLQQLKQGSVLAGGTGNNPRIWSNGAKKGYPMAMAKIGHSSTLMRSTAVSDLFWPSFVLTHGERKICKGSLPPAA